MGTKSHLSPEVLEIMAREGIAGTIIFDFATHEILFMNRTACAALEWNVNKDGFFGEGTTRPNLTDLLPQHGPEKRAHPHALEIINTPGYFQDIRMRKRNGITIMANISVSHIKDPSGRVLVLVSFQDITVQKKLQRDLEIKQEEIKKALKELLEQNRQLTELDRAKDRFIALASHELRTPLSAIVAMSDALRIGLHENEMQKDTFIEMIHDQGTQLMALVNDILDLAKVRAGKMDFFIEPIDVEKISLQVLAGFQTFAQGSNVTLTADFEPGGTGSDRPYVAYADAVRLKEVINNVVHNAIKFNHAGGLVTIKLESLAKCVRVTITDNGVGMSEDSIQHVFNEFETIANGSRHHKGTGLGMPISKRYMNEMGGDLLVTSTVDVGSSFSIEIPKDRVVDPTLYRSRGDLGSDQAA